MKRKSVLPSSSLDQFLEKQGIHISGEKEHDVHTTDGVRVLPTEDLDEHNTRLDDPSEQEEIGEDEWSNSNENMNVDCGTNGVPQNKNVRGPTICKKIHARSLDEREVVTFDLGQEVGPTDKAVSKCPAGVPAVHLHQLIEYWKLPEVKRRTKENNEEPLKAKMFVATRTKTGKEVQADTQIVIYELENHQNIGETLDDAFTAVFGKEKLGRVRGYGRSVTRTSLKKDEEMNELKQKDANEVTSMKEEIISEMREEMRQIFSQLVQNNPGLIFQDVLGSDGSNIPSPYASNAQAVRGKILSNSFGSAHASVHEKDQCGG
ncbi:hypothetical protein P3L10_023604 [Capsicum annuum]